MQLTSPGRRRLGVMVAGAVLLTAIGAVTMAAGLAWSDALRKTIDPGRAIIWYETIHFPWQLVFGLLLGLLMRKPPEPRKRWTRAERQAAKRMRRMDRRHGPEISPPDPRAS
jgi:hypothetical protein